MSFPLDFGTYSTEFSRKVFVLDGYMKDEVVTLPTVRLRGEFPDDEIELSLYEVQIEPSFSVAEIRSELVVSSLK